MVTWFVLMPGRGRTSGTAAAAAASRIGLSSAVATRVERRVHVFTVTAIFTRYIEQGAK